MLCLGACVFVCCACARVRACSRAFMRAPDDIPSTLPQLLAVATCGAAGAVQQGAIESFVLRCCRASVLFSLRVCVYLRATQPLADPLDVDGGCSCSCFTSARARVKVRVVCVRVTQQLNNIRL